MEKCKTIFNQWATRTYPAYWKMAGDMPERLEFLLDYFKDESLESIVEFGPYEGCSTSLWMLLAEKRLETVDPQQKINVTLYAEAAKDRDLEFVFTQKSDLEIPVVDCDLLFIDTMHTVDHTYKELMMHHAGVKKYIVMHDTNPEFCGTQEGIEKWAEELWAADALCWKEIYNEDLANKPSPSRACGLSIWQRI
jgi:S-ribosylhomocysteine lyase LuxS involved in autoinducer biosynthesis